MGRNGIRRQVSVLFLGQLVSLFLALSSFTSSYIAHLGKHPEKNLDFFDIWIHGCCSPLEGVDTPLTQCFFTYLVMSLVFGSIFLYQRKELLVIVLTVLLNLVWYRILIIFMNRRELESRFTIVDSWSQMKIWLYDIWHLQVPWYCYFILAILNVHANYLGNLLHSFTTCHNIFGIIP